MVDVTYAPPVSQLLTYGDCIKIDEKIKDPERDRLLKELSKKGMEEITRAKLADLKPILRTARWPNYVEELGFTEEHVPELIQMATDKTLNALIGEDLAVWAPVHAWRSLGQLKAVAAIDPLLFYFNDKDAFWAFEELPWVMGLMGEDAIAPLAKYLGTRKNKVRGRTSASESLERIGLQHPELRITCAQTIAHQLEAFEKNPETLNGFLVSSLIELGADGHTDLIQSVYLSQHIDETICGTWPHVQVDLGLAKEEDFSPEELKLPIPEWVVNRNKPARPTAFEVGFPTKAPADDLSMVFGKGKLSFGKRKQAQESNRISKGFGGKAETKKAKKKTK